jgi:glycosyltransferase involved in cell wall biosynthesis
MKASAMKFSFVISDFSEQTITALPWKYVYELAKKLGQKECEVQIITDGSAHEPRVKGVSIRRVFKTRQPPTFSPIMNPRQVDSAIEEFSPDLVCLFGDPLSGYFVRRLRNKTPTLVNVSKGIHPMRRLHFSPYFHFLNSPMGRLVVRLLNQRKILAITVPTLTIKSSLRNCGVNKKIVVLPMAFDKKLCKRGAVDLDKSEAKEELGFSKRDCIVAYFGPPYVKRGVTDLVRAIAYLKEFPVKLLLLLRQSRRHESQEVNSIKRLALKLGVADRITLVVSVLSRGKLIRHLESSDIIALPFRYVDEEPPLGLLEAMALGKPVIATNVDSLPEIVGRNRGILVRPGSVSDLAKAIHHLFKHPDEASSMAFEGIKYAKSLGDWDDLADCFLHLVEESSGRVSHPGL